MKQFMLGTAMLVLVALQVWADQDSEKAALKQRHDQWVAAWNQHDPHKLAMFWSAEGDLIDPFGVALKGREAIDKFFQEQMAPTGPMGATTYNGTVQNIRFLTDDIAIVDVEAEVTGLRGPDGQPVPLAKHHVTWVARKEGGKWMAVACRPVFPQKMSGTTPLPTPLPTPGKMPTR